MTLVAPLLALAAIPGALDGGQAGPFLPVAEVRERASGHKGMQVCVQGVATMETGILRSGQWDFYLQDQTGGIVIQGRGPDPVPRGAAVTACGRLGLYDDLEPQIEEAGVRLLGEAKIPQAELISIAEALDGAGAGKLIRVRGVVQRTSAGETRDVFWLGPPGPALRVYIRRDSGTAPFSPPGALLGATVEATGILIPEERGKFQIRLRTPDDVAVLEPPGTAQLKQLRFWLLAAAGLALAIGLWVLLLRRAVRRQTAEIRRLMVEARQSEEAKSRFLANMSHEIRTPLNGILGMTELALESNPGPEQRSYLETVRSSARALLEIVNDVLDLSRIEKGKMRLDPQPFHLRTLVDELIATFELQARQKDIRIELECDGRLPEWVVGDEGRLRQVLVNLIGNAVKFTPAGWVRLHIAPGRKDTICFTVSDSGPGIPAAHRSRIFHAFVQVDDSASRQYGGSGLGLTISDHLVRLMGGELRLLGSRPGEGAVFSFAVPLPGTEPAQAEAQIRSGRDCIARGLRLLVAEDNEINRRALESLLRRDGHFVRFAADGAEAVEKARAERFDAILMDVQMPGVDGLEATRQIRQLEAATRQGRVPIVGLTAHAFPEDARRCLSAGMDDYLAKPYHIVDLRRLLSAVASGSFSRA
jgi:signal transduction histidine kinase/ActR/RegA family two-component response regulator